MTDAVTVKGNLHHVEIGEHATVLPEGHVVAPDAILYIASHLHHVEVHEHTAMHSTSLDPSILSISEHLHHVETGSDAAAATGEAAGESDVLQSAMSEVMRQSVAMLEDANAQLQEAEVAYRQSLAMAGDRYDSTPSAAAPAAGSSAEAGGSKTLGPEEAATRIAAGLRGRSTRRMLPEMRKAQKAQQRIKSERELEAERLQALAREKLEKAQAVVREAQERLARIQKQQEALQARRMSLTGDEYAQVQRLLLAKAQKEAAERREREEAEAVLERQATTREATRRSKPKEERSSKRSGGMLGGMLGGGKKKGSANTQQREMSARPHGGASTSRRDGRRGSGSGGRLGGATGTLAGMLTNRSAAKKDDYGLVETSQFPGMHAEPEKPHSRKPVRKPSTIGLGLTGLLSSRSAPRKGSESGASDSYRERVQAAAQAKAADDYLPGKVATALPEMGPLEA